jgi:hypothetical protein
MSRDFVKSEERKMLQDIVATEIKKDNFIREIVEGGLGDEIIKEPNKINVPKQKKITYIDRLKKLFLNGKK